MPYPHQQLSPASESSARPLVTVSPTRLCFNYELGQETMRELVVTNIAGKHVAFKVKATTAMWNLFIVKPQLWSLGAGSSTRIEVTMKAQTEATTDPSDAHRFGIQAIQWEKVAASSGQEALVKLFEEYGPTKSIITDVPVELISPAPPQPGHFYPGNSSTPHGSHPHQVQPQEMPPGKQAGYGAGQNPVHYRRPLDNFSPRQHYVDRPGPPPARGTHIMDEVPQSGHYSRPETSAQEFDGLSLGQQPHPPPYQQQYRTSFHSQGVGYQGHVYPDNSSTPHGFYPHHDHMLPRASGPSLVQNQPQAHPPTYYHGHYNPAHTAQPPADLHFPQGPDNRPRYPQEPAGNARQVTQSLSEMPAPASNPSQVPSRPSSNTPNQPRRPVPPLSGQCINLRTKLLTVVNRLAELLKPLEDSFFNVSDMPQIAVCGGQSSGKSSLLESIIGRKIFPTDIGQCTKRPLRVTLRCHEDADGIPYWYGVFDNANEKRLSSPDAIREKIAAMQSSLSKNQFSDEEISLTLYSNEYSVPLTLVDLPGLIVKPPEGSRATTALLRHYGNRSGCILLAVMIAGNDLSTDFLFHEDNLSSLENSPEKRTMAVFTRMDRLQCPVQRAELMVKLDDLHSDKFQLGRFFVVNKGVNASEDFSREYPAEAGGCGFENLLSVLSRTLESRIRAWLPTLEHRLAKSVAECGDAKANATPRRTGLSSKLKLAFDHVHEHIDTMRNKDTKGASLNFKHLSDKMQRNLHGAALKNKMLRALDEVAKPEVIEAAVGQDLAHMSRYANRSMSTHDMCQKLIANKMGEVCKDVIAPCEEIVLSMVTELLHQVFTTTPELVGYENLQTRLQGDAARIAKECRNKAEQHVDMAAGIYQFVFQNDVTDIWNFKDTYKEIHPDETYGNRFSFRNMKFTKFVDRLIRFLKRYNKKYVIVMMEAASKHAIETVMIRNLKKEFNALYQGYLDHEGEDPGLTSFLLTESESMATQRAREEAEMQHMSNRKKILEEALQLVRESRQL